MSHRLSGVADLGPVLLLGGSGMLGRGWRRFFDEHGVAYAAPGRSAIDFEQPESIASHLADETRLVVNCAAFTDVDGCEDPEVWPTAERINGRAVALLAQRCRDADVPLLHYSTDYVFDGRADRPYRPDDPIAPINAYGRSKAIGERSVRDAGGEHLILRTSWLYAPWGKNFVRTMVRLLNEKPELRVVHDQRGCPTSVEHLVERSVALVLSGERGTFHVTDGGACTWFEFTTEIARRIGSQSNVEPCTTADFPRPAPRPAFSVLDTSATESAVGPMPGWPDNLATTLAKLEPIES